MILVIGSKNHLLGTFYNRTLPKILYRHAPLVTKTFIERPLVPWYNDGGQVAIFGRIFTFIVFYIMRTLNGS